MKSDEKTTDNFCEEILTVKAVGSIEESDIIVLLLTKEYLTKQEGPYQSLITKLALKEKKLFDLDNIFTAIIDSDSGLKKIVITGLGEESKVTPNI
ncbi:MAG: hypothetical protein ACRC8T_01145, partial [Acidaminococcaceae bacterium]